MTELVEDEYEKIKDDPAMGAEYEAKKPELEARKNAVFDVLDHEPEAVRQVSAFFGNADMISDLKMAANLSLEYVTANCGITWEMLEAYYKFSKFKYECGIYDEAEKMLGNFLSLTQPQSNPAVMGALWGRLNCRILQANWDSSLQDLQAVKECVDNRGTNSLDQIRLRGWLLHAGLFVHLNQREGFDSLIDFYYEKNYLTTMENLCPWLLRYLTVAVVLSKKRRSLITEILSEIQSMKYLYSDPITEFIECLFNDFDFDEAQKKLSDCKIVLTYDFFLSSCADKFLEEARLLIFELYCAINKRVDLRMLASKLELSEEDAEKWMVNMVRGTMVGSAQDAKVDSAGKQVIMPSPVNTTHAVVVERSRDLTERSAVLANNLDALAHEQASYIRLKNGISVARSTTN
jgi:translation initiation factor 3 subunit E